VACRNVSHQKPKIMEKTVVRMRRLGWAGVEMECDGETLVIDYVQDTSPLAQLRSPDEPFPLSSQPGNAAVALLTHLHADHADPSALAVALRPVAPVFRPAPATGNADDLRLTAHAEAQFAGRTLATEVVGVWEERRVGPFRLFTAPAVDGFGDPQHSWIVECGGRRIMHAGDTLFHGYWWRIAHRFAPFDVVFLPINGPVVEFPPLQPASPLEAVMTPEQAAVAAHILQARAVVPIHYGALHKPPMYVETPHPTERLRDKLSTFGIQTMLHEPGDWFELG
jgi:L-ascorbate metabolism protein UlaG (beta-lactamase superfamily)